MTRPPDGPARGAKVDVKGELAGGRAGERAKPRRLVCNGVSPLEVTLYLRAEGRARYLYLLVVNPLPTFVADLDRGGGRVDLVGELQRHLCGCRMQPLLVERGRLHELGSERPCAGRRCRQYQNHDRPR